MATKAISTAGTTIITAMLERAPGETMPEAEEASLATATVTLLAWLSPAFPVGAYTYSHGLEWAIEDGTVGRAADLEQWLGAVLRHGGGRNDAILFAHAHRAAWDDRVQELRDIAALAAAFQPSRERHLEATAQGRAFLVAVSGAWSNDRLAHLAEVLGADAAIAYPVAVAIAAAAHRIPIDMALVACLNAFVANIVSAGIRAIPIGQTDGQRVIAALAPVCREVAEAAAVADLDELGGMALRADIASMKHETQYTRLFRS